MPGKNYVVVNMKISPQNYLEAKLQGVNLYGMLVKDITRITDTEKELMERFDGVVTKVKPDGLFDLENLLKIN